MTATALIQSDPIFDTAYAAANDNGNYRYRQRLAYPALRWLIKHEPEAALVVFHYIRNLSCTYGEHAPSTYVEHAPSPSYMDPREHSADDAETHDAPSDPSASLDDLIASSDSVDEANLDRLHEVRPGLHQLLRSAGGIAWPWCGVREKRDGKIRWVGEPWAYEWTTVQRRAEPNRRGVHVITLGGLTYYTRPATAENPGKRRHPGGMLVTYTDDSGRLQRPIYRATKPRGGKSPHRTAAQTETYLSYPPAIESPLAAEGLRTPMSGDPALGNFYHPMIRRAPGKFMDQYGKLDMEGRFGVEEARDRLRHYGVDGSVPFEALPFPATKCPTRRAKGARFIAGITASKETKSVPAIGRSWVPEPMTGETAIVLDEVAARGNLTRIGMRLGKRRGYADRYAKVALLAAANDLIAANDNDSKKMQRSVPFRARSARIV